MTIWILILGTVVQSLIAAARVRSVFRWHLLPWLSGRQRE